MHTLKSENNPLFELYAETNKYMLPLFIIDEEKKAEENIRKYVKNFAKRKKEKRMLWSTLFHKLGKQQLKYSQHNHVYALLENPKTHQKEKVYLLLKHNAAGHPYFVQDFVKTEKESISKRKKIGKRDKGQ